MRTDTLTTNIVTTGAKTDQGRGLVTAVAALAGAFMLAAGVWALAGFLVANTATPSTTRSTWTSAVMAGTPGRWRPCRC